MAIDHSHLHLGKRPRRHDARTLKLARYLAADMPAPPAHVDYTRGITNWGVMLNDQLGCCTIAAVGHAIQTWTVNAGSRVDFCDDAIRLYYQKWDGYDPADRATDQGGVELDVLNQWRQQGFAGHGLDAFAALSLSGVRSPGSEVQTAIWLFGGCYIGVELPITAQKQEVWDVAPDPLSAPAALPHEDLEKPQGGKARPALQSPDEPGSWGGHAVYLLGYDFENSGLGIRGSGVRKDDSPSGIPNSESLFPNPDSRAPNPQSPAPGTQPPTLTCITWGEIKKMTWAWFEKYCSEAYALVSRDWLNASGLSPSGFDFTALEEDLKAVSGPSSRARSN